MKEMEHAFILLPGTWLGEGKIELSLVQEELAFFTRWNIQALDDSGLIESGQQIQIKGMADILQNQFIFSDLSPDSFKVELENTALGKIEGKGVLGPRMIGWEFRAPEMGFEGFEIYEKIDKDSYYMTAEFATADQLRTIIKGKIWRSLSYDKLD